MNPEIQPLANLKPYTPVSCDLTDELEVHAMHRDHVILDIRSSDGIIQQIRGSVADVFTKDHADFLRLEDGRIFRLDQIEKVEKT